MQWNRDVISLIAQVFSDIPIAGGLKNGSGDGFKPKSNSQDIVSSTYSAYTFLDERVE